MEHIVGASIGGYSIPPATSEWLTKISLKLRTRLEQLQLVEPEALVERERITIGGLVKRYLSEIEVKPRTVVRYRNQTQFMQEFFGRQADISELANGDGERFLKWLKRKKKKNGEPYGPNYIHKIVKTSRQVFGFAVADDQMNRNVLEGVKAPEVITDERDFEITSEMTEKILKEANPTYRLIIALARYGGLRCPSEFSGLRWSHILGAKDRFIAHSPKTEHCGKEKRIVPIFAELLPTLLEAREIASNEQDAVFPDIHAETNLRTETQRILIRAGITEEIPRFYQNCRSSRQTELEAEFPLHVVCKWLGNSERTAKKHYLKVRDSHFQKAASAGMQQSMQNMSATCSEPSQADEAAHEKTLENDDSPAFPLCSKYTREVSNRCQNQRGNCTY